VSNTITANLYFWLTILFEDLIADPEAILRQVCAFMHE